MLTDTLQTQLNEIYPNLNFNKILDILLGKKYKDLLGYLNSEIIHNNEKQNNIEKIKRVKSAYSSSKDAPSIEWASKLQKQKSNSTTNFVRSMENNFKIEMEWKFNTTKCVDATPLIVKIDNLKKLILIGSHSSEFFCISSTGEHVWSFKTLDRIESSAIVSKCGRFVVFGCYDSYVYVLGLEDGKLEFKLKTDDIVKSSPCLNKVNGHIYFGSYDKSLYCISIEVTLSS